MLKVIKTVKRVHVERKIAIVVNTHTDVTEDILVAEGYYTLVSQQHNVTGRERLIRSHSSARFCFELSGNSN